MFSVMADAAFAMVAGLRTLMSLCLFREESRHKRTEELVDAETSELAHLPVLNLVWPGRAICCLLGVTRTIAQNGHAKRFLDHDRIRTALANHGSTTSAIKDWHWPLATYLFDGVDATPVRQLYVGRNQVRTSFERRCDSFTFVRSEGERRVTKLA